MKLCSVQGCERPHIARGFCDPHWKRWRKRGSPGPATIEARRPGAVCSVAGCERPHLARGYCNAHYLRWKGAGSVGSAPIRLFGGACMVEGCSAALRARGLCDMHYQRWRKDGDPGSSAPRIRRDLSAEERFWLNVSRGPSCWAWTGAKNAGGYGCLGVGGRSVMAHRFAYELLVGPIPEGLTIDHLCGNRSCVNPEHLEPVTQSENVRRARAAAPSNV